MSNIKYDNVDDRKELFNILNNHLDDTQRKQFLEWCCKQVNTELNKVLRPGKASSNDPKEVYWQLMSLAFMHGCNLDLIMNKAVEFARKGTLI